MFSRPKMTFKVQTIEQIFEAHRVIVKKCKKYNKRSDTPKFCWADQVKFEFEIILKVKKATNAINSLNHSSTTESIDFALQCTCTIPFILLCLTTLRRHYNICSFVTFSILKYLKSQLDRVFKKAFERNGWTTFNPPYPTAPCTSPPPKYLK